jgi:hypothetical protein
MTNQDHPTTSATPWFVQFTAFKVDPAWRRLPQGARADGREAFAAVVDEYSLVDNDMGIQWHRLEDRRRSPPLAGAALTQNRCRR